MRSPCTVWVAPKSNDKCLYKRHMKERVEGHVKMEAEAGGVQPQAGENLEPPEAGRGQEGFPLESMGAVALLTP